MNKRMEIAKGLDNILSTKKQTAVKEDRRQSRPTEGILGARRRGEPPPAPTKDDLAAMDAAREGYWSISRISLNDEVIRSQVTGLDLATADELEQLRTIQARYESTWRYLEAYSPHAARLAWEKAVADQAGELATNGTEPAGMLLRKDFEREYQGRQAATKAALRQLSSIAAPIICQIYGRLEKAMAARYQALEKSERAAAKALGQNFAPSPVLTIAFSVHDFARAKAIYTGGMDNPRSALAPILDL